MCSPDRDRGRRRQGQLPVLDAASGAAQGADLLDQLLDLVFLRPSDAVRVKRSLESAGPLVHRSPGLDPQ
jgi:hypothetical protein